MNKSELNLLVKSIVKECLNENSPDELENIKYSGTGIGEAWYTFTYGIERLISEINSSGKGMANSNLAIERLNSFLKDQEVRSVILGINEIQKEDV